MRAPATRVSALVACFIGAAYWFTASTSFANPAAVLGRMCSDTFAGIAPRSAPAFALAELAGAAIGVLLDAVLQTPSSSRSRPNPVEASGIAGPDPSTTEP